MSGGPSTDDSGATDGESVDDGRTIVEEPVEILGAAPERGDPNALSNVLAGLDSDARLQVERVAPAFASGWLEDLAVPQGQESEILGMVRAAFGGGSYKLRVKRRHEDGRLRYTAGSARVTIVGEPHFHGRRYNPDGTFKDETTPAAPTAPTTPMVLSQPGGQPSVLDLARALQIIQQRQVTPTGQPVNPLQGLPELVAALNGAVHPQPVMPDAFGQVERVLRLVKQVQGIAGDGGGEVQPDYQQSDMQMMMMLMGGGQQQQPMGWPGAGWPQQQPMMPPMQPMQPAQPAQQAAQPAAPQANDVEDLDEDEPYTTDEVLDAIHGLSDADKMNLLTRLGETLPAGMGPMIEAELQKMGGSNGG